MTKDLIDVDAVARVLTDVAHRRGDILISHGQDVGGLSCDNAHGFDPLLRDRCRKAGHQTCELLGALIARLEGIRRNARQGRL